MRALSAAELLDVWERGLGQPLAQRTLTLLAAVCPEADYSGLAALPIGKRDARLLQLREWLFGPQLTTVAVCPVCGEQLESPFNVSDMRVNGSESVDVSHSIDVGGYHVTFRLPASSDLLALNGVPEADTARRMLLKRCLTDIRDRDGETLASDALPGHVVAALDAQMTALDPLAHIELQLTCPACDHQWAAMFDIASFLWKEINTWAQRTLRDVHRLARAYGWREADVLALSPTRRQIYLELCMQ